MLFYHLQVTQHKGLFCNPETTGTQTMSDCDWSEVHKSQTIRHRLAVRQCAFGYCAQEPEERPEEGKETEMWGQTRQSLRSTWDEMTALLLWESLVFYASVKPLVFGLTVTLSALSDKNSSWMSLISISLAVYTLESLSRGCRNSILCSVRHDWKQTRENAS